MPTILTERPTEGTFFPAPMLDAYTDLEFKVSFENFMQLFFLSWPERSAKDI